MEPDSEALRQAVEGIEAEIGRVAQACAEHIRCPMTPEDKAGLQAGLAEIAVLRQELVMRINQYRFWRPGNDTRPNPPLPFTKRGRAASVLPRTQYLNVLDARSCKLAEVTEGLALMPSHKRRPLYAAKPAKADPRAEQLAVSDRIFTALHHVVNPTVQAATAADLGCYPDIPLPPSVFLAHAHAALRVGIAQGRGHMRFIDVGCGGGVKVMLASEIFAEAEGLEYDPGYVAAAQAALSLLAMPRARVFQADALEFANYGEYDVIYFYQPISNVEELARLERRIVAQARPGTVLIAPYYQFEMRAERLGCGQIAQAVYVTGIGPKEAVKLRSLAETTGTSLISPVAAVDPRDGYLAPLIAAARRIGFNLG